MTDADRANESTISRHWGAHFKYSNWESKGLGPRQGLGTFIPRTALRMVLHYIMQTPFRRIGADYQLFQAIWRAGCRIAKIQGRVFDLDDLRQVLSLACAQHFLKLNVQSRRNILIIGDGYARLANLILAVLPNSSIILVNLAPSLEVDLMSMKQVWPNIKIQEPKDHKSVQDLRDYSGVQVLALRADDAELLQDMPLDGVFNVSSMQEMTPEAIARYFDLMRNNKAASTWFYCANAWEKILIDGSITRFREYPWSVQDDVVLDERCPWGKKAYQTHFPKYVDRPFPIHHRIVRFGAKDRELPA